MTKICPAASVLALAFLLGCSSVPTTGPVGDSPLAIGPGADAPSWVAEGSGFFAPPRSHERQLHAVSHSPRSRTAGYRRQDVDSKANAEMLQVLEKFVERLPRLFRCTLDTTEGAEERANEAREQERSEERALAARLLKELKIVDHHVAPDGSEYALAVVSLESLQAALAPLRSDRRSRFDLEPWRVVEAFDEQAKEEAQAPKAAR